MSNLDPNNTLVGVDVLDDTLKLGNLRVIPETLHRRKMSASRSLISSSDEMPFYHVFRRDPTFGNDGSSLYHDTTPSSQSHATEMDKVMVGRTSLIRRVYSHTSVSSLSTRPYTDCLAILTHAHGCDKGSIVEGDATDSDGLEELGRVLVLLVHIVIEERTDGLWLLWEEGGVALDLSGGVWEDVGHGECEFSCR